MSLSSKAEENGADKQTQKWLTRFTGIKSEEFVNDEDTMRIILWNELEDCDVENKQWIKGDRSILRRVRR